MSKQTVLPGSRERILDSKTFGARLQCVVCTGTIQGRGYKYCSTKCRLKDCRFNRLSSRLDAANMFIKESRICKAKYN